MEEERPPGRPSPPPPPPRADGVMEVEVGALEGVGCGRCRSWGLVSVGREGEGEGSQALARQEGSWLLERASERVKGRGRGPGRAWVGRVLDMRG